MVTGGVNSTTMGSSSNPTVPNGLVGASGTVPGQTTPVVETTPTLRRSSENRRSNKPIMEKRRRARINNCLNELKSLILDAMKKDPARHSKLEKADILEMTVKHLESLQRQQVAMTVSADPSVLNKYRAGFSECASEVGRFLGRGDAPPLDPHVKRRLLSHLSNCLSSVGGTPGSGSSSTATSTSSASSTGSMSPPPSSPTPMEVQQLPTEGHQLDSLPQAAHSNVLNSVQLVPTRLPNGDIALVLPSHHSAASMFRVAAAPISPAPSSSASSTASQSPPPHSLAPFLIRGPPASTSPPLGFALSMSGSVSPRSSASSTSEMRPLSPPMQKPLSLVTRRTSSVSEEDEVKQCWRPW